MVVVLKGSWSVQIKKFLKHNIYGTHSWLSWKGRGGDAHRLIPQNLVPLPEEKIDPQIKKKRHFPVLPPP